MTFPNPARDALRSILLLLLLSAVAHPRASVAIGPPAALPLPVSGQHPVVLPFPGELAGGGKLDPARSSGKIDLAGSDGPIGPGVPMPAGDPVAPIAPPTRPMLGDVNLDGKLDVEDAALTLRATLGLVGLTAIQAWLADVNHDGRVDLKDVVLILRAANGDPRF